MSDKPTMHGGGESYSGVVPAKQPNKGGKTVARTQRVPGGKAAGQGEHGAV